MLTLNDVYYNMLFQWSSNMILKYVFLSALVFVATSCSNNECSDNNNQVTNQIIQQGSRVDLYRGKELVVSVDNDTEVVKGFDSCAPKQTRYLSTPSPFQRQHSAKWLF